MSDLIPYEVIIERVKDDIDFIAEQAYERGKRDILEQSQSAQPEREKGKWIVFKAPDEQHCGLVKCPFCGEDMIAEADEYSFCPNCGADMRGEQE